jgi:fumarate hydratase subunit beta
MPFGEATNGGDRMIDMQLPLSEEKALGLRAGDQVRLSGYVYTARDAAHRRMHRCLEAGEPLPIDLADQTIYYVGPTPAFGDHVIGSAGPTTALRMDRFTPALYRAGLRATIGKGNRSEEVRQAIAEHKGVYFAALGGGPERCCPSA